MINLLRYKTSKCNDFEYGFWFWSNKLDGILAMLSYFADYKLDVIEIAFIKQSLIGTNDELNCWTDYCFNGRKKTELQRFGINLRIMSKINLKLSVFVASMVIVLSSCSKHDDNNPSSNGTMTDQDGNVYKTVTIGSQIWMAENLRTAKYNDGTAIPLVTDNTAWANLNTGAYCNYNNTNNNDPIETFGKLYNWYAVNTGKLAPIGWHVPTDAEWTTLSTYLGGESIAGGKLKEIGTTHWNSPNTGATNEKGFTALPGGVRGNNGTFYYIGNYGSWWSATEIPNIFAWYRGIAFNDSDLYRTDYNKKFGESVRCLKD